MDARSVNRPAAWLVLAGHPDAPANVGVVGYSRLARLYRTTGYAFLWIFSTVATFFVITPKVIRAHRDEPVRTGWEELIGRDAEVREQLDPVGQVWIEGALWKARAREAGGPVTIGTRVKIESVDGLTLVVSPFERRP